MKKVQVDYFFELYEKNSVPILFSKVTTPGYTAIYDNPAYSEELVNNLNAVYSVFFIPDYLKPVLETDKLVIKKVLQFFKGYAIFLEGFETADAYIKHRFKSNAKGIRRRVKRLETCFDISYKTYHGAIAQEEYNFFMDCLEQMLIRRFQERNDVSQTLVRWDHYKRMYYSLINDKKASLFVVLEQNKPIVVSLNHHFQKRLFSAISSYDIDFAKFSLGSVEIYKKLDWLIAHDHISYEMGMGDLSYKREWCNHIYNFEHQIIYPKKSIIARIKGRIEYIKVRSKEYVFKIAYVRYKNLKLSRKKEVTSPRPTFELAPIKTIVDEDKNMEGYTTIDYNEDRYSFLRRIVFDFLYSSIENVANVKVYKNNENTTFYIIKGISKMQTIKVNK